ncbi:MAG: methylmalonyl-CoA mutase family protein [Planctomycetota bacterium]|nr:methylmalonyl-CoA mutase family protein [Planctomycetota bacterium]
MNADASVAELFPAPRFEDWRRLVDADLKGAPFERKLVTRTYEGFDVRPLYTAADRAATANAAEYSGLPTFARGALPLGNAQGGWDIRQERAEPLLAELNAAILEDLSGGVTSILVRLDAATRAGLDPDDLRAVLLSGVDGATLISPSDWSAAFQGVYLNMIGVTLEAGAAFVPAAAQLAALWELMGVAPEAARGGFHADPLAVLAREGSLPQPLDAALRDAADLAAWTSARYPAPQVTALRVGTAAYHHAGATATQDLAFALATGLEYLRAMTAAGMHIDAAARQIHFSYAVGTQFFLAIAKLRAARTLWRRVVTAAGGSQDAARAPMHVRLSRRVVTTRDPWVNILRNSAAVFAAGIAGADAVGSLPYDAALDAPSAVARRLARNTQAIMQEECHLHRINDPAGGSYYIDTLTDELAAAAWKIFQEIERRGGMAACLTSGWIAGQIESAFAPRARSYATRKDAVVGVSEFPAPDQPAPDRRAASSEDVRRQALARLSAEVAAGRATTPPDAPTSGPAGTRARHAFEAALAGATIGRIARSLGLHRGESASITAIAPHPFAEPFEHLRDAADEYAAQCGERPRVFLASMGTPADHLARTNYAKGLFEAGGFEATGGAGYADVGAAIAAFMQSRAHIAVICSSDAAYAELIPTLAPWLHRAGARVVILAGNPGEREARDREAGVDRFIYVRCDVVRTLTELLREEGVTL